jgi:hypothetical protein
MADDLTVWCIESPAMNSLLMWTGHVRVMKCREPWSDYLTVLTVNDRPYMTSQLPECGVPTATSGYIICIVYFQSMWDCLCTFLKPGNTFVLIIGTFWGAYPGHLSCWGIAWTWNFLLNKRIQKNNRKGRKGLNIKLDV